MAQSSDFSMTNEILRFPQIKSQAVLFDPMSALNTHVHSVGVSAHALTIGCYMFSERFDLTNKIPT